MFIKSVIATTLFSTAMAVPAMAQNSPANTLNKLDWRLDNLERRGVIEQGSRMDKVEDRIDRFEDKVDRREDRRDRQVNHGPRDRIEDRVDARENRLDRRENRWDRRR